MDIHTLYDKSVKACKKCGGTGVLLQQDTFIDCTCMTDFKNKMSVIRSRIPSKYHKFDLRNLTQDFRANNEVALQIIRKYTEFIQDNVEQGYGLFFQAQPGLGKTSLACYILIRALHAGLKAGFIRYSDLITLTFKSLEDSDAMSQLDYLRECDIICIDRIDHGYVQESAYARERIDDLFSHWHSSERSLLITSNTPRKDMVSFPFSYIFNDLIDIVFVGESFRGDVNALQIIMSRNKEKG